MKQNEKVQTLNELIFEDRNKAYGAYELRTNYEKRLYLSFTITLSVTLIIFFIFYFSRVRSNEIIFTVSKDKVEISKPFTFESRMEPSFKKQMVKIALPKNILPKNPQEHSFLAVKDSLPLESHSDTLAHTLINDTNTLGIKTSGSGMDTVKKSGNPPFIQQPYSQVSVEKLPEFPGGMERFYNYLLSRIHYTNDAKNAGLSGKIFISFVIDENGLVSGIKILKRIGYGLDESVCDVLKNSPRWKPGFVSEKPVRTEMILPVSFNLR